MLQIRYPLSSEPVLNSYDYMVSKFLARNISLPHTGHRIHEKAQVTEFGEKNRGHEALTEIESVFAVGKC